MKSDCAGRSMVEMLGVLTIIGALSVGGVAGFSKAIAHNKVNTVIAQIGAISAKVSAIGSNSDSYDGIDNTSVIKLKAVPNDMVTSSSTLRNPFGGSVSVYPSTLMTENDKQAYVIQYDGLNKEPCLALATHNWGNAQTSSFIGISVGKTTKMTTEVAKLYKKCSGSTAAQAATACNKGSTMAIPMTVVAADNACDCAQGSCSFAIKYY
ncbi:MAG: hypothetical protein IKN67_04910 [Alphaproteobacteria bacterium]|nr:hypothetical protein [Alphaproteobacteria bacterium]